MVRRTRTQCKYGGHELISLAQRAVHHTCRREIPPMETDKQAQKIIMDRI